ncbi:caspase family protein [Nocardia sp. BSTN01]|uniref:caspase family protein n=1 Tax=Nocardia sp. BSTN01 TaxID=2783665 RepID=UPI00188E0FD6|nr:caspase family protein [Nocardia sp. BSTN01]MBF4995982.1 caspase family protein [Nocardia sp. BSTN01]
MTGPIAEKDSRAVLIGASRYDRLAPIPATLANVADLADIFTAPDGAFIAEHCVTVTDAGRDDIGVAVAQAAREATGVLLVYYAGHGLLDRRGRLHLSVPASDPDAVRWTTVPFETLREEILESQARARVLILDCCFAGRAFEAMADLPGLVAGQTDVRGTYTITSSSANEPSFAPVGHRHTAFTAALLAAVAAIPGGTLDELYHRTDLALLRDGNPRPQRRNIDIAGELRLFGQPKRERTHHLADHDLDAVNSPETVPDHHGDVAEDPSAVAHAPTPPPQKVSARRNTDTTLETRETGAGESAKTYLQSWVDNQMKDFGGLRACSVQALIGAVVAAISLWLAVPAYEAHGERIDNALIGVGLGLGSMGMAWAAVCLLFLAANLVVVLIEWCRRRL